MKESKSKEQLQSVLCKERLTLLVELLLEVMADSESEEGR